MPLPSPNLDDRNFESLMQEALAHFKAAHPESEWDDLSPSDPGRILLELFAYLTDVLLYRLNQLPDKVYVALLNLIGVRMRPPAAARVELQFSRDEAAAESDIVIRRGTRVTAERASGDDEPLIFTTVRDAMFKAGETQVMAIAYHSTEVSGERLGVSSGQPGQIFIVTHAPIIAPTPDGGELAVGVEADPRTLPEDAPRVTYEGKTYRLWQEVDNFSGASSLSYVYRTDRLSGTIEFAPAIQVGSTLQAVAALPPANAEIRAWYRYGGGSGGNVSANTLTTLKDPVPGVSVTNLARALGGGPAETLENALKRGPQELRSLNRVITAYDYEAAAVQESDFVVRAYGFAQANFWSYATPGTVVLLAVPEVDTAARRRISLEDMRGLLHDLDEQDVLKTVEQTLDARRPLGTWCVVQWAYFKSVRVHAEIVPRPLEDQDKLQARIEQRVYDLINPYPTAENGAGWRFGEPLRVSDIYNRILAEPGVNWVRSVVLQVDDVPDTQVHSVAADYFQPHTWYAGSDTRLFRSLNDVKSWELLRQFENERVLLVRPNPARAGWLAVILQQADGSGVRVSVSQDCGETWVGESVPLGYRVYDAAWIKRGDSAILLLASDRGLFEFTLGAEVPTQQIMVDRSDPDLGFYTITTRQDFHGLTYVAIAAQDRSGVYLSMAGAKSNSFRYLAGEDGRGLRGQDVRSLTIQQRGSSAYLWAGIASAGGDDVGAGCFMWELRGTEASPEGWTQVNRGWAGGTCWGLAADESTLYAATHRQGVARLITSMLDANAEWQSAEIRGGLPLRNEGAFRGQFVELRTLALNPSQDQLVVGCEEGVYTSSDGLAFHYAAQDRFTDQVDLPETWLFVSGKHEITVTGDDGRS
jgi:hypothetical protein